MRTKIVEAVVNIIRDARRETATRASYKRMVASLTTLGIGSDEQTLILTYLDYLDADGNPYPIFGYTE